MASSKFCTKSFRIFSGAHTGLWKAVIEEKGRKRRARGVFWN